LFNKIGLLLNNTTVTITLQSKLMSNPNPIPRFPSAFVVAVARGADLYITSPLRSVPPIKRNRPILVSAETRILKAFDSQILTCPSTSSDGNKAFLAQLDAGAKKGDIYLPNQSLRGSGS
jgi:hypothetical protein